MKQKRDRWYLRALALMLASMAAMVTVSAAAEAGSEGDPLVTLSYLNETFLPKLLAQAGTSGSGQSGFALTELSAGQSLTLSVGSEVMLRVGSAACGASSAPGLIDETTGGSLDTGGALVKNHLYMATMEGRTVKAGSGGAKLLVRGGSTLS